MTTDRPTGGEPTTEAGRQFDSEWPGSHIDRLDWRQRILAIEEQSSAADIDSVAAALHEELRGSFGVHIRGHNEPEAYGLGAGWCHCRSVIERILASEARASSPPPLDVEQLALAMMNTLPDALDWEMHAEAIAAEYQHLSPSSDTEAGA